MESTLSAMQLDVLSRLDTEARSINELDARLRDRLVAFDVLLRDALHLGLEENHLSEDARKLIYERGAAASPKRPGRFTRRRSPFRR